MQLGFYFDQTRCIGCHACVAACRDWNMLKPGPVRYRNVKVSESGSYPNATVYNLSMACNHCATPACIPACANNAIYKRNDGVVLVDKSKCTELGACVTACPYSQPQIADDAQETSFNGSWQTAHPVQKCTFCWDRLEIGQQPSCVGACPARALDCGDIEALRLKYPMAKMAADNLFPGMPETKGTGPSLLINVKGTLPVIKNPVNDI